MNILLTGEPHVGKSTLLARIVENYETKQGFVTQEIPDIANPGQRLGFKLIDSAVREAVLAHIAINSDIHVSKYGVDIDALNGFIKPLMTFYPEDLLYIDEIGQMELYSDKFKKLVEKYIDAANNFIGTITTVYSDAFVEEVKSRGDVRIIKVTPLNRDQLINEIRF